MTDEDANPEPQVAEPTPMWTLVTSAEFLAMAQKAAATLNASPVPAAQAAPKVVALTDAQILHRWDTHVGDPTPERPLTDRDKIDFARAVLAAQPAPQVQPTEQVPDGVWEALQRMIEDGATKGPASREDALCVARYRDRVRFLAPQPAEQVGEPTVPIPLNDAQHLLSWMDAVFGNDGGDDWFDQDAASVADGLESAVERFKRAHPALATPAPQQPVSAPQAEYDALQWKFECFIDFATGGKLSKSGWALETLKAAATEHINAIADEHAKEIAPQAAAAVPADDLEKAQAASDRLEALSKKYASTNDHGDVIFQPVNWLMFVADAATDDAALGVTQQAEQKGGAE